MSELAITRRGGGGTKILTEADLTTGYRSCVITTEYGDLTWYRSVVNLPTGVSYGDIDKLFLFVTYDNAKYNFRKTDAGVYQWFDYSAWSQSCGSPINLWYISAAADYLPTTIMNTKVKSISLEQAIIVLK